MKHGVDGLRGGGLRVNRKQKWGGGRGGLSWRWVALAGARVDFTVTGGERRAGRHATRVVEGTKIPTDFTERRCHNRLVGSTVSAAPKTCHNIRVSPYDTH